MLIDIQKDFYRKKVRNFFSRKYKKDAYLLGSGSEALYSVLVSIRSKMKTKKVLIPDKICPVVTKAVIMAGLKPVFVNTDEKYRMVGNVRKISTKAGALIVTHNYGYPDDVENMKRFCEKNSIILIEDCAQSFGAENQNKPVGVFGDYSIFSFRILKHVCGFVGGVVLTNENFYIRTKEFNSQEITNQLIFLKNLISSYRKRIYKTRINSFPQKVSNKISLYASVYFRSVPMIRTISESNAYLIHYQLQMWKKIIRARNNIAKNIIEAAGEKSIFGIEDLHDAKSSILSVPIKCRPSTKRHLTQNNINFYDELNPLNQFTIHPAKIFRSYYTNLKILTFFTDPIFYQKNEIDSISEILNKV